MKIPVEWLKQYIDTKKTASELASSFTALGLMLDKPTKTYTSGKYTTEVLDLEHRMDRADWLSIIGCARDLAAFENTQLLPPDISKVVGKIPDNDEFVPVKVLCPEMVNRFNTKVFRGIKIKPSPEWLKNRLEAYGIPSINNVVDITNYVMVELGQPMHAQDLNKMEKQEIVIRKARKGESIVTLLGETVQLSDEMFVLTQNDIPTVIGGIVGGKLTGVTERTTDMILDAGNYNQASIRKISRKLKIQNETVSRYDKYLHPYLAEVALNRASKLILELAGGIMYDNEDWYPIETPAKQLKLTYARLKKISGMDYPKHKVTRIISALGYTIIEDSADYLTLDVPYFRTDVEVEDDIISDILRISDYSNIPSMVVEAAPPKEATPQIYRFEDKLRDTMVSMGLHEHITDPIVKHDNLPGRIGLENALSSEKNAMRLSIYETLYPVSEFYQKHKIQSGGLFEIGKVYRHTAKMASQISEETVIEERELGAVFFGDNAVNLMKVNLATLLQSLGIKHYNLEKTLKGADILIKKTKLGEVSDSYFCLYTEKLLSACGRILTIHTEVPNTRVEDFSFVLEKNEPFGPILTKIKNIVDGYGEAQVIDEFEKSKKQKSILVRVEYTGNKDLRVLRKLAESFA